MESVVGEFAAVEDDVAEGGLLTADLGANDEECGGHVVALEGFEDVLCVLGGCVIDGQGDNLAIGLDMPEHVLPSRLEVVDQALWGFVDDVQRYYAQAQGDVECYHAPRLRSRPE